ncbi:MAG: hypothetical protein WDN28_21120 [Chthoniobacter sp.]
MIRTARALGVDAGGRDLQRKYLFKFHAALNSEGNIDVETWPWSPDWAHRWTETMVREFLAYRQEKRIEDKNALIKTYSEELKEVVRRLDQQFSEKLDFQDQQDLTRTLILVNSINNLPADLTRLQMRIDDMGRVRVRLQDPALDSVAKLSLISTADDSETRLSVGQIVAPPESNQKGDKKEGGADQGFVVPPSLLKAPNAWDTLAQDQQQIKKQIDEALRIYLPHRRPDPRAEQEARPHQPAPRCGISDRAKPLRSAIPELLNKKHDLEGKLPEYTELSRKHAKLLSQLSIFDMSRLPYDTYLANMKREINEVEFAGEKERINIKYAGLLEVRDDPVSPNRLHLMLMSLAAGIALAIGVPFVIEYLDHTMTNLEDVEHSFRLRGLGVVPQTDSTEMFLPSEANDAARHGLVENFRVIRTNVLSMGALSKPPHVVMVTSAMPKEGKTVVSSNLAASFALTGARTLLIDTDLRRGRLHRLFGYRKEPA